MKAKTMKITGIILALVMLATMLGMLAMTASANNETNSGSWGDVADVSFMKGHAGTEEDPYEISTAEQLAGLAALVNESNNFSGIHIKLTADIDLSAHSWVPIGIDTNFAEGASAVFSGFFDGAGHTVSGMTIGTSSMPEDRYQNAGLFGYVIGGRIKNLTVSGSVNLSCPSGKARVGGLVGYLYVGNVVNCHSQVNVTVSQNTSGAPCYVGGVVGHGSPFLENRDTGIIGCTNSGTVTVTCTCSEIPACYVGGVAGYIENMNSLFINCFNSGSVTGGKYTGGVVGYAKNDHEIYREMGIYNCANVGSVTGDGYAGGIVGYTDALADFANCYHAGSVSGAHAGGIVGDTNNAGAAFCYWLSGSAESASGDGEGYFDDCSALSEAQMKAAAGTTDESWKKIFFTKAPIALVDALNAYAKKNSIHNVVCTQWHICSAAGASAYPTYDSCSYTDNGDGNTHKKHYECCEVVVDAADHFGDVTVTCLGTVCEGCGAYYGATNSIYHVSTERGYRPDETEPYDYHNQHHTCCGALIEDTQQPHEDVDYTMEQVNDSEQYVFTKTCLTCNGVVGKQYITVADRSYSGTPYAYATDEMEGNFGLLEGICCCDGGCIDEGEHTLTFVLSDQHQFEIPFTITEHTENDHVFDSDSNGFCTVCGGYEQPTLNANGYYEIDNAGKLYWFAALVNGTLTDGTEQNKYANVILTADITVNENVLNADGALNGTPARVWTPIGNRNNSYQGTFDGNGHTVSGLYFNDSSTDYVGMFGQVGTGDVQNVGVIDSYFNANYYVGGVVGNIYIEGSVLNCYNTGVVNGYYYVGGVVGFNLSPVQNCYNTGVVSGYRYVGGVVGEASSSVQNCYNTGVVSGDYYYVGGVIGAGSSSVSNCYYLTGTAVGGINGSDTAGKTEPKTAEQFASGEVAYLLNADQSTIAFGQLLLGDQADKAPVFATEANRVYRHAECSNVVFHYTNDASLNGYVKPHVFAENSNGFCTVCDNGYEQPTLNENGYYEIDNAGKLYWFAQQVNSGNNAINGELTANIVVNQNVLVDGALNGNTEGFRVWTPIGNLNAWYSGSFDGNGYTVSGLYFNKSDVEDVGLFGFIRNTTVENVGVIDSYFCGGITVGSVVGRNVMSTVRNCYNTSFVSGNYFVGGVVGTNNQGIVQSCYNTGSVSGNYHVGGVAGNRSREGSYFANCYYLSGCATDGTGTKQFGVGDSVKGGTIADVAGQTEAKTAEQFASGAVAYLLGEAWGQKLGTNDFPVLGGDTVYLIAYCDGTPIRHSNTESTDLTHKGLNDYGYCELCQVKITGASITAGVDLTMKYYVGLYDTDLVGVGEKLAMIFTVNGKSVTVYANEALVDGEYVFAFDGIAPQQMADLIDATLVVVNENGEIVDTLTEKKGYSVKANAEALPALYPEDAALGQLVVDMLTYGAAAQSYKDHNLDNLANKDLSSEVAPSEALPTASDKSIAASTSETVYFTSVTVWFDNVNRIGVTVSTKSGVALRVNGDYVELTGTTYYTDAISATDFDQLYTFELYEGSGETATLVQTLTYSVSSYVYAMMNQTEADGMTPTEMAELAKALYRYGKSAEAYRTSQRVEITDENAECYTYNGNTATYDALTGWTPILGEDHCYNSFVIELNAGDTVYYELSDELSSLGLAHVEDLMVIYSSNWTGEALPLNGSITVETAGRFYFYLGKNNITVRAWVVRA